MPPRNASVQRKGELLGKGVQLRIGATIKAYAFRRASPAEGVVLYFQVQSHLSCFLFRSLGGDLLDRISGVVYKGGCVHDPNPTSFECHYSQLCMTALKQHLTSFDE